MNYTRCVLKPPLAQFTVQRGCPLGFSYPGDQQILAFLMWFAQLQMLCGLVAQPFIWTFKHESLATSAQNQKLWMSLWGFAVQLVRPFVGGVKAKSLNEAEEGTHQILSAELLYFFYL